MRLFSWRLISRWAGLCSKDRLALLCGIFFIANTSSLFAENTEKSGPPEGELTPTFSIANWFFHQSNPFFNEDSRSWMETSARLGVKYTYEEVTLELSGIAVKTTGRDPYGTPDGHWPGAELDLAYFQWKNTEGYPFKFTLGRQNIVIGSQFLIGDGAYDGFHRNYRQGIYHNPRRSFDAARLEFDYEKNHFDFFIFRQHPTLDGAGKWNGFFGGVDISRTFEKIKGTYALGLFYRNSPSDLDNDMGVFNVRMEQHLPAVDDLYISGEVVWEKGTGNNPYTVTNPGEPLDEYAWHAEIGYRATPLALKPFIELGYVYYSDDFTPVAPGCSDWGKWYMGNQIDWIIFGTDTKVWRGEIGFWPHPKVKMRAQYHHTELASVSVGTLSDEFSLIAEWFPDDHFWVNILCGYSVPGDGLEKSGLVNPFSFTQPNAVAIGDENSFDIVFAVGYNF